MPASSKGHILIAEDNLDIQAIYQAKLLAEGYDVVSASDGAEAFQRVAERVPDLILLDILMPGMGGIEFLRKASKEPALRQIPIVIMTNLGQDEDRKQCETLGATKFLIKTEISIDDLATMVKATLAEHR
jgi:CheY-like chemotaxis protein